MRVLFGRTLWTRKIAKRANLFVEVSVSTERWFAMSDIVRIAQVHQ